MEYFDEYYVMSYEEEKELLKVQIVQELDRDYNALTFNIFYQPCELFLENFYAFAYRLSSLHRYLEYSRRYFDEYISLGKKIDKELKHDKSIYAEGYDIFTETFYSDEQYFYKFNFEAILLMLYSILESFIIEMCKYISYEFNIILNIPHSRNPIIINYLDFLRNDCALNINFKKGLMEEINLFREIRNCFTHNAGEIRSATSAKKIREFYPDNICDNKINLNYELMIKFFEVVGELVKTIEIAYWERYEKCISSR